MTRTRYTKQICKETFDMEYDKQDKQQMKPKRFSLATRTILLVAFLLSAFGFNTLKAQQASVRATISPSSILIGQQALVQIETIVPKGSHVIFPVYKDSLVKGIEVLNMLKPDTVMNEVMTIRQKYIVTSFDSTLYHIPPMKVIVGKDTVLTNDLGLKVVSPKLSDSTNAYLAKLKSHQTDSVDFKQLQLNDIKDIQQPPFVLGDYIGYILLFLLIAVIVVLIVLVIVFYKRKKEKGYLFKPKVIRPPHEVALEELDHLKESKLWQKGMEKEFYTHLTDIIREYIKERFGINAPEMITEDIVKAIQNATQGTSESEGLKQILTIADLVKFAKYIPFGDENDLSIVNAYLFVNQTKVEEVKPDSDSSEEKSDMKSQPDHSKK